MTTKARKATKRDAEKVLAAVKKMYKSWLGDCALGPTLVKDWTWGWTTEHTYAWAIIWEEGPYEWTMSFPGGGIEEEFGFKLNAVELPDTVWTEPIAGWALGIYPAL